MAIGQVTAKVVLTVINLVFCVMAIILVMMGAWLFSQYFDYDHVTSSNSTVAPACLITTVGFLLLLVGILGFVITFKENKCLTQLFIAVLVLLLIALVVGAVLAYVFRKDIDSALADGMKAALEDYVSDKYVKKEVDFMQEELKCCGVDNYTDWLNTSWYKNQSSGHVPYPESCCENYNCTYLNPDAGLHKEGCYEKLRLSFLNHLTAVASVAVACAILLLLGVVSSAVLLYRRSIGAGYIGLPESDGLQV